MINCTHCIHAQWKKTVPGRLHPSGDGMCKYPYKLPPLPQSMYWISGGVPLGGFINRRRDLKDHCVYFSREQASPAKEPTP